MLGDVATKRRCLLEGLARIIAADVWAWAIGRRDPTNPSLPALFWATDGGWASDEQRTIAFQPNFETTTISRRLFGEPSAHVTRTRNQLASDGEWYESEVYLKYRLPAELDDFLMTVYRPSQDAVSWIGMHRRRGAPPFGGRERCIVHIVTGEIDWLHRGGTDLPAADGVVALSPRLRQVLLMLLAGDSRKQVANKLGISEHTVIDYVKALHRHFDVSSRGELLAKWAAPCGPGTAPTAAAPPPRTRTRRADGRIGLAIESNPPAFAGIDAETARGDRRPTSRPRGRAKGVL
jgi:DNA-binding CsgD family transcriptional regulator